MNSISRLKKSINNYQKVFKRLNEQYENQIIRRDRVIKNKIKIKNFVRHIQIMKEKKNEELKEIIKKKKLIIEEEKRNQKMFLNTLEI